MSNGRLLFENTDETTVKLDGKVVGTIKPVPYYVVVGCDKITYISKKENLGKAYQIGYRYYPKGQKVGGEIFATKGECMYSLNDMD